MSGTVVRRVSCVAAYAAVAVLSGCGGEGGAAPPSRSAPPTLVRVAVAKSLEVAPKVVSVGTVKPVQVSVVASGADGVVTHFEVEQGQFLPKKTLLSMLRMESSNKQIAQAEAVLKEYDAKNEEMKKGRPEDIRRAEAMYSAAQAVESNSQSQHDRVRNLFLRGVATDSELENAVEKLKAAQQSAVAAHEELQSLEKGARVEEQQQAEARLLAQQEQVAWLKLEHDKRTTFTPFDGFVVAEHTEAGQWLSKGDPIATLAKMDQVEVTVNVDQWALQHLRLGQPATVVVDGAEPPTWSGTVTQIVPRSDWQSGSRGFPVIVRVKNELRTETFDVVTKAAESPGEADETETVERVVPVLKEGMMARVTFAGRVRQATMVPKDALVRDLRGTFMHLFTPADPQAKLDPKNPTPGRTRQVRVDVDLSLSEGDWTAVKLSDDNPGEPVVFDAGTVVVTEGGERLRPVQENIAALERIGAEAGNP